MGHGDTECIMHDGRSEIRQAPPLCGIAACSILGQLGVIEGNYDGWIAAGIVGIYEILSAQGKCKWTATILDADAVPFSG